MSAKSPSNISAANVCMPIIGIHESPLSQKFGTPRQPNLVNLPTKIVMLSPYCTPAAFEGIKQYSHLWITWQFNQNKPQENFRPMVRPPRLGGNDKLGVFATRSMYRPSQLGLSVVALEKVEVVDGKVILHILGADMVDGTPIIDIKPYLAYSDSIADAASGFASNKPVQKNVSVSKNATLQFNEFLVEGTLQKQDMDYVCDLIAQDPRPAYKHNELNKAFKMCYKTVDVGFVMTEEGCLLIDSIKGFDGY